MADNKAEVLLNDAIQIMTSIAAEEKLPLLIIGWDPDTDQMFSVTNLPLMEALLKAVGMTYDKVAAKTPRKEPSLILPPGMVQ